MHFFISSDPLPINYPVASSPDPEPKVNVQRKRSKLLNMGKFFTVSRSTVLLNKSDEFPNYPSSSNFKSPSYISDNDEICIELSVNRKSRVTKNSSTKESPGDQIEWNSTPNLPKFVYKKEQKPFESDEISILIESETNSNSIKKASSEKNMKINSDRISTNLNPIEKLVEPSRIEISPNSNEIFENIHPIFLLKHSPRVDQWVNFDPRSIDNFDNSCALCQQIEKNLDEENEFFDNLLCTDCRTPYKNWFMEPWKFVTIKCRCENSNEIFFESVKQLERILSFSSYVLFRVPFLVVREIRTGSNARI